MPLGFINQTQSERESRQDNLLIAGLAAGVGLAAGFLAARIYRAGRQSQATLGEQVSNLVHQGGERAQQMAQSFVENAEKVKNNVKDQVELVAGR